jgi:tetraacyldisaccharide 4'-kinase
MLDIAIPLINLGNLHEFSLFSAKPKGLPMFRWLLLPFSFIYSIIVWIRNKMFDLNILRSREFNFPVIVVGNITVGGTGKTPHVEYLIRLLKDKKKVAVLSRGYKRKSKGFIVADESDNSIRIGDEPRQIKRKFPEVAMAVDANRIKGITKLMEGAAGFDPDVILLDDAFQHRYVKPGMSILLVDYNKPLESDYILPYGRLRESMYEKKRANIVIVTKTPRELKPIDRRIIAKDMKLFPYQSLYFTYLKYGDLTPAFDDGKSITLEDAKEQKYQVLLVTGIANPVPMKEHLQKYFDGVDQLEFPDHHAFLSKDVKKINKVFESISGDKKIIITTEKDAVRIFDSEGFKESGLPIYYLPIEVEFLDNDREEFEKKINAFISNNRKASLLNRSV